MTAIKNPVILIPARLASTRFPGKPLAEIGGEAMIVHVWRRAVEADLGPVFVACADGEIARVVKAAGGDAVMTGPDHPSGSDRIFEALGAIGQKNRTAAWVNLDPATKAVSALEIRAVDDIRGSLPDTRHGVVILLPGRAAPILPRRALLQLMMRKAGA